VNQEDFVGFGLVCGTPKNFCAIESRKNQTFERFNSKFVDFLGLILDHQSFFGQTNKTKKWRDFVHLEREIPPQMKVIQFFHLICLLRPRRQAQKQSLHRIGLKDPNAESS
jgi:hypothetical protein